MNDAGAIEELLEERPDLRAPLGAILAVDEAQDTWTFDDLDIDSGPFGELVSRDVVESVGDEYRLAEPAAVRAALDAEVSEGSTARSESTEGGASTPDLSLSLPSLSALRSTDRTTAALVGVAIAIVALVRTHAIGSVYRNGDIVLSGNDPYYYRYWVEQVAAESGGAIDVGALSQLPFGVQKGEPLLVATLWWLAELLGGGVGAIGHVMAWYPVVAAALTAGAVYVIAVRVTGDRRIALASVLLLAIVPGHALRTSVGFADHHAFDFVWLAGTAYGLVALADADRSSLARPRTWLASAGLGVCVAGQVLAWEAGPLLIAPAGLAVLAGSLVALRRDDSPLVATGPTLAGLAVGTVLAGAVHAVVGWHTAEVAFSPAVVLAGSMLVVGVAAVIRRTTGDPRHALAVDLAGGIAGLGVLAVAFPSAWSRLLSQADRLLMGGDIAETASLFDPGSWGFLLLFGFVLVLALPAMVWAVGRAVEDTQWAILAAYAWYFLLLAGLQVRFVGELAAFAAVFAGVGFVWVAAWIETVPWPTFPERPEAPLSVPDRSTLLTLVLLFALVGSLGLVQVPVKTSQVTIEGDAYASAAFVADRSAELNQTHPDNRVFSEWGRTRMYNYFVNGESESYGYAQNNFGDFLAAEDPDDWYNRLDGRHGYVVVPEAGEDVLQNSTHWQLARDYGSATTGADGTGHYQVLYRPPDRTRTVFAIVPGARLTGTASANATVTASMTVEVAGGESVEYTRRTTANANGNYAVRVAHPGEYEIDGGNRTVVSSVNETAVRDGLPVSAAG